MSLGFNSHKDKYTRKIEVVKDFTNAIFFGRTGTGKTTGAILPTIEDRIKSDYGLLIYDFKGNLHLQTKYLANKFDRLDDVVEIGKPWGENINILNYLTTKQFLQIVQSNTQAKTDFWDIASRNLLEGIYSVLKLDKYIFTQINKLLEKEYENKEIPRPENWGGYIAKPYEIEFWQGRPNRLHDRIIYELQEDYDWKISRLAP